jgi:hypothetical protein
MGLTHFPHGIFATPNLGGSGDEIAPELFGGTTFYVDYEHGSDSNSGTFDKPVKQINRAITLSNSFKDSEVNLTGDLGFFRRNKIYVRPWGAAATAIGNYDPITVIPQHCDIIGMGSSVLSNGSGIVGIGSSVDATAALTVGSSGMRGVRFYNLQFLGGGTASNVFSATGTVMRCGFYNCSFYALPATNAHINTTSNWAGNTMYRVHFAHNLSPSTNLYNFASTTGVQTDNLWEECMFNWASTNNVYIGTTSLSHGSIMRHCIFGQAGAPAVSFHDHSVDGGYFLDHCAFDADATDPLERVAGGNDAGCIKGKTLITGSE